MRCPYHTFHMGYYLLEYALIDDYLARRTAFREAHLTLAREAHRRGDLILAGALAEPADRAVLVWQTDDRSVVERFIDGDPYVRKWLGHLLDYSTLDCRHRRGSWTELMPALGEPSRMSLVQPNGHCSNRQAASQNIHS
jgi:uncharacterized protein YciI